MECENWEDCLDKLVEVQKAINAEHDRLCEITTSLDNLNKLLRGEGMGIGMIGILAQNTKSVEKLMHEIYGNGKEGIADRLQEIEWIFSNQGKVAAAFFLALVGALGGGLGAWIVSGILK